LLAWLLLHICCGWSYFMAEPLTTDDLITMERAARKFQGAFTGTSGQLAGFVILLLGEVRRLRVETAELRVAAAMKENEPHISY
jgi:hypothetical protein